MPRTRFVRFDDAIAIAVVDTLFTCDPIFLFSAAVFSRHRLMIEKCKLNLIWRERAAHPSSASLPMSWLGPRVQSHCH